MMASSLRAAVRCVDYKVRVLDQPAKSSRHILHVRVPREDVFAPGHSPRSAGRRQVERRGECLLWYGTATRPPVTILCVPNRVFQNVTDRGTKLSGVMSTEARTRLIA